MNGLATRKILKKLDVEFIEQPLKADDWGGHKTLFLKSILVNQLRINRLPGC